MNDLPLPELAAGLFNDLRKSCRENGMLSFADGDFESLGETGKSVWTAYCRAIPEKLLSLNIRMQPFTEFCLTCIITDSEMEDLVDSDLAAYDLNMKEDSLLVGKEEGALTGRKDLDEARKLLRELNYNIPYRLKLAGYELLRPELHSGIDIDIIRRIARALHSKYSRNTMQIRGRGVANPGEDPGSRPADFDSLPGDLRFSNLDNAFHIPAKLLAIGYRIRPVQRGFRALTLKLGYEEIETMARIEHIRWCWDKRLNGWTWGRERNDSARIHPGLVPYDELSEEEKDKDRDLVMLIPSVLKDIGYEAYHINPGKIRGLAFAVKPQSSIHRILHETRELNEQLRKHVTLTAELEEIVKIRNMKIEEAITEVRESYNYAQHIQETFLPDNLYVRECFPESFILFKPKDIVSGDFYFLSSRDNLVFLAVADCTGHGIPGALLSTIGYGILEQAVDELGLSDSSEILVHLYSRLHRFLRRDAGSNGISDDMDIALCVFDMKSYRLTYSGVKIPLWVLSGGELAEYHPLNQTDGCRDNGECSFDCQDISVKAGDTIYLFSDGYADQFGGRNHKRYSNARFRDKLRTIGYLPLPEQSDLLYDEIEKWREENDEDQTDDILVAGIRL